MKKLLKNILIGFIIWTCYTFLNAGILSFQQKLYYPYAWISSAVYNYSMALLSIPLWYLCKKFPFDKSGLVRFFGSHLFGSLIFSLVWLTFSYSLYYAMFPTYVIKAMWAQGVYLWQYLDGITKYGLMTGIFYTIDFYKRFKEKELRETQLNLLTKNMELQNLKSQINPHFLFNALNSVNALITRNPEKARTMNAKLAQLLRYSLDGFERKFVTIKEELDFIRNYLDIEKVRFGKKLQIQEEIDPQTLESKVPSMLLQPIVENAIKHGISLQAKGGILKIHISQNNGFLQLQITNNGKPVSENDLDSLFNKGIGLKNTHERLKRIYGDVAVFKLQSKKPDLFSVSIKIPQTIVNS